MLMCVDVMVCVVPVAAALDTFLTSSASRLVRPEITYRTQHDETRREPSCTTCTPHQGPRHDGQEVWIVWEHRNIHWHPP